MSARSGKSSSLWQFILASLIGCAVGLGLIVGYAYGTAEWWLTGRVAGYCALALVPVATAVSALFTAWSVGSRAARGRMETTHPVLLVGLLVFAVASIARVYPVRELTFQLPTYIDASPSLSRMFTDLEHASLPLLGRSLGQIFTLIYLVVEALVLFGALVLIARWAISAPYCYMCKRYCQRHIDVATFATAPLVQTLERLQARDWSYFRSLGNPVEGSEEWFRLDTATCPGCARTNTVSLYLMSRAGKRRDGLILDVKITEDDLRTVQRLS